jgi:hypothetical protein
MERIADDTGHRDVRVLIDEIVDSRQFPEWTMGFQPVAVAEEASIPGYRKTFDDLADDTDDVSSTTPAVRALIRWFQSAP